MGFLLLFAVLGLCAARCPQNCGVSFSLCFFFCFRSWNFSFSFCVLSFDKEETALCIPCFDDVILDF